MKLIIVESPTKARTIGQFLGAGYKVESSYGHVRDLPKSKISIDVKADFEPTYTILPKAKEHVAVLKKLAGEASEIILATDEDREGEAIAWHLTHALELGGKKPKKSRSKKAADVQVAETPAAPVQRIVFHEITKQAIEEALEHPRSIDMNLVDAQQARRILDRLVGYELSPFLWRRVRYGLSAGRVQSVAVRLVVEREREIQKFDKEEYWSIEGDFCKKDNNGSTKLTTGKVFRGRLISVDGNSLDKMAVKSSGDAEKLIARLKEADYRIKEVSSKEVSRNPSPPFTTSTLQQEASRKLGFSAKQTMMLAQGLYENGFITYMRTDSVNLAEQALKQAQTVITNDFGKEYSLESPRRFATKSKGAQEAHEAIRPTDLSRHFPSTQDKRQVRLYELIWKRTLASQMKEALLEQTVADIETHSADSGQAKDGKLVFRANGQRIVFPGFLKVYFDGEDEAESDENILPKLEKGEPIVAKEILPLQHFTEPPPRYTDASLIKTLETAGIGRPSTYAPTLSTIQDRGYVEKIEKRYHPTEVGIIVNDILVEHFPEIVDINFTSHVEEELDLIAEGKIGWREVAKEFYGPFKKHLIEKEAEVGRYSEVSETPCPHCGKQMLFKFGRFGKFLACPDPESKVTLPMPEEAAKIKDLEEKTKGEKCPLCGKEMGIRRGRFGFFLGCVDYPKCKGIKKILNKTGFKCPNCLASPERKNNPGDIIEKKARGRGNAFYGCSRYPDCNFIGNKKPLTQEDVAEMFEKFKTSPRVTGEKPASKKSATKTKAKKKSTVQPSSP